MIIIYESFNAETQKKLQAEADKLAKAGKKTAWRNPQPYSGDCLEKNADEVIIAKGTVNENKIIYDHEKIGVKVTVINPVEAPVKKRGK